MRVGFIGLGLMGSPMAKNILTKGFPLTVYNRTPEKTQELVALGAAVADSISDVSAASDVLITMVTSGKDVEEVLLGENGITTSGKKDLVVIDMSTIGPSKARDLAQKLDAYGLSFVDAPVTGSTARAKTGELTIFAGGETNVVEKVMPVLSTMGTTILHMGPVGSGQAIKLINNYVIASSIVALSEGMLLADGMGLPREKVAQALEQTPNISPTMQMKLPNLVHESFPVAFSLANMRKDIGLAFSEMEKADELLPGIIATEKLYKMANDDTSFTGQDFTVVMEEIKKAEKITKEKA